MTDELSTWEWVKQSARTNRDRAVIVRFEADGNFSFLHGDPTLELERELAEARAGWGNEKMYRIASNELLGEVARSGVSFDDARVDYVEVQISREVWNEVCAGWRVTASAIQDRDAIIEECALVCVARTNIAGAEGQDTQLADHELLLAAEEIRALKNAAPQAQVQKDVESLETAGQPAVAAPSAIEPVWDGSQIPAAQHHRNCPIRSGGACACGMRLEWNARRALGAQLNEDGSVTPAVAAPSSAVPNGWIATGPSGQMLHFARADGWDVQQVLTLPSSATQPVCEQEPVGWRYRYAKPGSTNGMWRYADTADECNPHPDYEREPVYGFPWKVSNR